MKANHILFGALAVTLISAYTMSPNDLLKHSKIMKGRIPASAEEQKKEDEKKSEVVLCKEESKGEKLQKDLKATTEDIEAVLKEIDDLKKENKELKEKAAQKKEEKVEKEVEATDMISLMSQMTTMFTAQMQSQMEMQFQMMDMLSQWQFRTAPQYTWDWSQNYQHPLAFQDTLTLSDYGIGLSAPRYSSYGGFDHFINPYAQAPQLTRQPAQQSDFGFSFDVIPQANNMRGFDFNQGPAGIALPQMQRQQMPSQEIPKTDVHDATPLSTTIYEA